MGIWALMRRCRHNCPEYEEIVEITPRKLGNFCLRQTLRASRQSTYQASLYLRFREALPRPFKLEEFANSSEVVNLWIASQIPVKLWISEWQMRRRWLNVVGLGLQKRFFLNFECLIIDILLNGILFIIRTNSCWKSCWDVGWRKAGALVRRYLVVAHTRTHVCRV